MTKLYLDWNVITTLRQPGILTDPEDIQTFDTIINIINSSRKDLLIPYSNAHLTDLLKSYRKGERVRVNDSLKFISELTLDVCLTQYWNDETAIWHYRNPDEYFHDLLNSNDVDTTSLETIVEPLKEYGLGGVFDMFKHLPHNIDFTQFEESNLALTLFFKKSRTDNSMYAVMEDFINLSNEMKYNPTVYNELKNLFKSAIPIDPTVHNATNVIETLDQTMSKTMLNKSFTQLYEENERT